MLISYVHIFIFLKSKSEYKDFAVNCKISQSRLACRCCTFSLPHDIFLTKSIIYMGFKFNLNVMNLNWALLYFKVVGLLFCKLTFSTRDSTRGFWFQLLSLALLPPPPFLSLSHLPKSNPAPLSCGPWSVCGKENGGNRVASCTCYDCEDYRLEAATEKHYKKIKQIHFQEEPCDSLCTLVPISVIILFLDREPS